MPDYGAKYTDKAIAQTEAEIRKTYRLAKKELKAKLDDFERKFAVRNQEKQKALQEGKISEQEYKNWLTGQVFIRNQWQSKIRQISEVMHDCNRQAVNLINNKRLDVFAENYNYMAFRGEMATGISFGLYNSQAVARLMQENPKMLPEWNIDEEKDYKWNEQKVNNIVRQGIIQGESIPQIANRLCDELVSMNENKMNMFARTAMTEAQNAGRQQQMNDAADMGIDIHKQWLATLDSRTRDSHRKLDGQEVPYNENFVSLYGEIEYPGDPDAEPADVFNCRCTMVSIYPKYEDRSKPNWREEETIDGMTYQEWKEEKTKNVEIASTESTKEEPGGDFVPAKTIEEAEAFAKTFIDTSMWASFGISYEGVSLETANEINRTLYRFYKTFKVDPLSGIMAPRGNTKFGKAIQGAHAAFSPLNRGLLINRNTVKTPELFKDKQRQEKEIVSRYLRDPSKFVVKSARAKKVLDASAKSGRSVVADTLPDAIHHELGHAMEKQLRKVPGYDKLMERRSKYAEGISGYATDGVSEYIAESFCAWMRGEKCVDPELVKAFESLKR